MGIRLRKGSGAMSEINVTPLIDIVLVMLIIFMVITPRTVEEMAASLPGPKKAKPPSPDDTAQLVVAMYDNGDVALNLQVMSQKDLATELGRRLRARDKRVAFIDAHPDLPYGQVVGVMDLIRASGAERVGLARMKEDGPERAEDVAPAAP